MPTEYIIDAGQCCIFMYLFDVVEDWQLGVQAQQLWDDPLFKPQYARLIDGRDIRTMNVGPAIVRAIAEDVRIQSSSNTALVAGTESVRATFRSYAEVTCPRNMSQRKLEFRSISSLLRSVPSPSY